MKKILSIISVVAVAAVLALNVSLSKDSKTGNVNLASISVAPEASAECAPWGGISGAGGKCLQTYYGECVFGLVQWGMFECDPYVAGPSGF